jgi:hypothetical protein
MGGQTPKSSLTAVNRDEQGPEQVLAKRPKQSSFVELIDRLCWWEG